MYSWKTCRFPWIPISPQVDSISYCFILRSQIEKYYAQTAGIVFMIDGTDYNVKDIAEYTLLT